MANWIWTVKDANTGALIEGAAVSAQVSTTPCPYNSWLGQSATKGENGCTSGPGYPVTGNTGSNGEFASTIPYTTEQTVAFKVTANGYNATSDSYTSGSITGDVPIPTVFLTPVADVPQSNQGTGGTASTEASNASSSFLRTYGDDIFWIGFAVVAIIVILVVLHAVRG